MQPVENPLGDSNLLRVTLSPSAVPAVQPVENPLDDSILLL